MEQKKLLPRVPKFEQQDKQQQPANDNLQMEIENFFNEINASTHKNQSVPMEMIQQTQVVKNQIQKPISKDFSSLNNKLTNILKKKELLNAPAIINTTNLTRSNQQPNIQQGSIKNLKSLAQQQQEYDPARPNDYEEALISMRMEQQVQSHKPKAQTITIKDAKPVELFPTPLKDNTKQRDLQIEEQPNEEIGQIRIIQTAEEKALKMMERQGFKLGQGLGKNSQGMTTPLIAKKTNDSVGVIKSSHLDMSRFLQQDVIQIKQPQQNQYEPTRVLVLLNMVTPSQVDDELESEIITELSKYGKVQRCVIYMLTNEEEDMAVRIFVEFLKKKQAQEAFFGVDGRVFEKRIVVCRFYSEQKFQDNIFDEKLA